MKILVLDNYDSFTYNLVHILEQFDGVKPDVFRNDKIALEKVMAYDKIVLSPGPGLPSEAGIMMELIGKYAPIKPILGVCLGHQGIAESFGAKLKNLSRVMHGVATPAHATVTDEEIFKTLPSKFMTGRYHSWVVDKEGFPETLQVTAEDEEGIIMAIRHTTYDVKGVQFHPESVLTPHGKAILENWVKE